MRVNVHIVLNHTHHFRANHYHPEKAIQLAEIGTLDFPGGFSDCRDGSADREFVFHEI